MRINTKQLIPLLLYYAPGARIIL